MTASNQEPPFTAIPPNAPGYQDFRMMADWASAIRDQPLCFPYDTVTGRVSVSPTVNGQAGVFTTPDAARGYVVGQVDFAVGEGLPLPLNGDRCSALFWSESSVEKFLFPYLASASSDDAARFLGRLSNAWYGYPGRVVQVCALAYHYSTQPVWGELSLNAAVGLVCLERVTGKLRLMGLDEFERTYPTGAARGWIPGYSGGMGSMPQPLAGWQGETVDSIAVREAAEFVSGMRGHYVWFTHDDGVLTPWVCETEDPGAPPAGTVVAQGVTVAIRPDRPVPSSVTVRLAGQPQSKAIVSSGDDPTMVPDAMFWTDGAVEKLLLPYYASVKGRIAPLFNLFLMGQWDGVIPPGIGDLELAVDALRRYTPSRAASETADAADDDPIPPSTVYAIAHLPRSEYVNNVYAGESLSPAMEHRTAVLTFDGREFNARPLFVSAQPARRRRGRAALTG